MNKLKKQLIVICILVISNVVSFSAYAEQGDWIIRARIVGIIPDDSSGLIRQNGTNVANTGVTVDAAATPEIDVTYMITNHIGVEAIAGTAKHTVSSTGTGLGLADGFDLFDSWVIPPTISLQYHFMPDSNLRPYVGAGVNYTFLVDDTATGALETALGGAVNVATSNEWGWSLQAGVDYDISDKFFLNLDLKYIDVDTTASLDSPAGNLRVDLDIDPWVVGVGVGMRF